MWLTLLGVLLVLVLLAWRTASSRVSLPCPAWLSWLVELDNPLFRNNRAQAIIEGLMIAPSMRVLDAGCGPGRLTIPLAKAVAPGGTVVALDLQPQMLVKTEKKAKAAGLANIVFEQGALGTGTFHAGPFDRAVLTTVLGEIPDQRSALSELFAALRGGGVLAITELIADPHFQRRRHVVALAEAVGFRERHRTGSALSYTLYLEKPQTP
jgi:ubiquinone/menaquinone biosynthesis C-methylase UbiE